MGDVSNQLAAAITSLIPRMKTLLSESLRIPSVSGDEATFAKFIRDFAISRKLTTDLWETDEADLADYPVAQAKHLPLAGRPTLMIGLQNPGSEPSLIFNAHSDVVSAGALDQWKFGAWCGAEDDGKLYGRGACDVKGALVSALWAILALQQINHSGNVLLELVPGEEDCVTLGTLTSVVRGYRADACIVLEPTECLPRNASRPGLRFHIDCKGRAVHGTVKWLGEDAIALAHTTYSALKELEARWNDRSADPLFDIYPIARPVTVDTIHGGQWQGMICDDCRIAGYLELLPNDEPSAWMQRFIAELQGLLDGQGIDSRRITVQFPESYQGHSTDSGNVLCRTAESILDVSATMLKNVGRGWTGWSGFNSGCEAGLRANLHHTPTLVWGPGSLAQAHAADEFVNFDQVQLAAELFARFAIAWGNRKEQV